MLQCSDSKTKLWLALQPLCNCCYHLEIITVSVPRRFPSSLAIRKNNWRPNSFLNFKSCISNGSVSNMTLVRRLVVLMVQNSFDQHSPFFFYAIPHLELQIKNFLVKSQISKYESNNTQRLWKTFSNPNNVNSKVKISIYDQLKDQLYWGKKQASRTKEVSFI